MGNKRKYKDMDEEKIQRKIIKLQKTLKQKQNEDRSPERSLSPLRPDDVDLPYEEDHDSMYMPPSEWAGTLTPAREQSPPMEQFVEQQHDLCWSPQPGPSGPPTAMATVLDENLDESILNILGDAPKPDTEFGKNIHKDVAGRWQDILRQGLPKDVNDKLVNEYLIPGNCDLLVPPMLNPKAKAALTEAQVKRDHAILNKQKHLSAALAALAQVTDMLIANECSKEKLLKPVSDASRLLCDIHNVETRTRRRFVINSINGSLKGALIDTSRDKFLFGENLTERLNAAKSIQKSGDSLKIPNQQSFYKNNFNNTKSKYKGNLNNKALHPRQTTRRYDVGPARTAAYRMPPGHRTQPPPPHRRNRSPPPLPPPPMKNHQPFRR